MGIGGYKRTHKFKSDKADSIISGDLYLLFIYLLLLGVLLLSGEALAQATPVKIIPPKHRKWPGTERYVLDLALTNLEYNLKKVEKTQPSIKRTVKAVKAMEPKVKAKTETVEFSLKTNPFQLKTEAELKTSILTFKTVGNLNGIISGAYYKKAYLESKRSAIWIGYRTDW